MPKTQIPYEFYRKVKSMREAQMRYEETKRWNDLQKRKALEYEVDEMLKHSPPDEDEDPMVRNQLMLDI